MTGDARMFNSINSSASKEFDSITFGDNGKGKVQGLGKIAISNDMSISNVLLVESLNFNLLSVAQLCDLGFKCIFSSFFLLFSLSFWIAPCLSFARDYGSERKNGVELHFFDRPYVRGWNSRTRKKENEVGLYGMENLA